MSENDTILVHTADATTTRRGGTKELQIDVLAENVNIFFSQIEQMLAKTPDEVGQSKFKFTEISVTAEISGQGKLILLGTGVEAAAKGGITFKFERK